MVGMAISSPWDEENLFWATIFIEVPMRKPISAAIDEVKQFGMPKIKPEDAGMSINKLARIGLEMEWFVDHAQVPGLVTIVARHGQLVYADSRGYADVKKRKPLIPETIFRLFSMTKPITCAAVMMLYEEGLFSLDDPIADYLPEFEMMKVWSDDRLVDAHRPITIRHLLTHTAGFTYSNRASPVAKMFEDVEVHGVLNRLSGKNLEQHVRQLSEFPLLAQPGTAWNYGESMGVLGRLLEVLSGCSFREVLKKRLLEPLGMVDTDFFVPQEKVDRLASLYDLRPDGVIMPADPKNYGGDYCKKPPLEYGGAGLVGTVADYLRFAQMLLNKGEFKSTRFLSPSSVKLMMSNQLGSEFGDNPLVTLDSPRTKTKGLGFGFGGSVTDSIASSQYGSLGEFSWGGWANTDFWIDPKQDLIGMIFTQVIPVDTYLMTRSRIHELIYQAIIEK